MYNRSGYQPIEEDDQPSRYDCYVTNHPAIIPGSGDPCDGCYWWNGDRCTTTDGPAEEPEPDDLDYLPDDYDERAEEQRRGL